jgi:hypothetical protein
MAAPAKVPRKSQPTAPVPPDQSGFAPRLPTPDADSKKGVGWRSGQDGAYGDPALKGNGTNLPQVPMKEPLDEAYPPKVRLAVESFLADWIAQNLQPHLVRFPFRKMLEQHGIEGVRELCQFIAPKNRKIANICRTVLGQLEILNGELEAQKNQKVRSAVETSEAL